MANPEDIFAGSLEALYDHAPVTYASSGGGDFVYHHPTSDRTFNLVPPDTTPANHRLHASDIWVSSVFLADHIDELGLDKFGRSAHEPLRILELGAGAGLPSIVLAKTREDVRVVVSDYPDPRLIHALEHNVARNELQGRCTAVPHAWGSPPAPLFTAANDAVQHGFDAVLAADTLWNSDTHEALLQTLCATLRRGSGARAHFVAGLHTGRWALSAFVKKAEAAGLALIEAEERAVRADVRRPWKVDRGSEDESERRRWIVWFVLSWAEAKG